MSCIVKSSVLPKPKLSLGAVSRLFRKLVTTSVADETWIISEWEPRLTVKPLENVVDTKGGNGFS